MASSSDEYLLTRFSSLTLTHYRQKSILTICLQFQENGAMPELEETELTEVVKNSWHYLLKECAVPGGVFRKNID